MKRLLEQKWFPFELWIARARADCTVNAVLVRLCCFCCCKFGCDDIRCHLCVVVVSLKTQLLSLQCESWYIQQLLISNYSRKRNSLLNGFNCSLNELRRGKTISDFLITNKVFFLSVKQFPIDISNPCTNERSSSKASWNQIPKINI